MFWDFDFRTLAVIASDLLGLFGMGVGGVFFFFECCFTSIETTSTIKDGEPRTATSIFTQLLTSVLLMLFYVHRDHKHY